MTSKISAVLAAVLVLGSASVALAANSKPQAIRQQPRQPSVMLLEEGAPVRGPGVIPGLFCATLPALRVQTT